MLKAFFMFKLRTNRDFSFHLTPVFYLCKTSFCHLKSHASIHSSITLLEPEKRDLFQAAASTAAHFFLEFQTKNVQQLWPQQCGFRVLPRPLVILPLTSTALSLLHSPKTKLSSMAGLPIQESVFVAFKLCSDHSLRAFKRPSKTD